VKLWYYPVMEQRRPEPDPFFGQLKKDVQEGIDAADRDEVVDAEDVWREFGLDFL